MPSSLLESFLSALQSALSVLLTLAYGVGAAKLGLLKASTAKDISHVCIQFFLPALLITSIGGDLAKEGSGVIDLWPVLAWAAVYPIFSLLLIWPFVRWLNFPTWSLAAVAFNNTTALPLLLLQSLRTTGLLDPISGSDASAGADRAVTFFLLNAMVNNVLTFAMGPAMFGVSRSEGEATREDHVGGLHPDPLITGHALAEEEEREARADGENAPLLPKTLGIPIKKAVFKKTSYSVAIWFSEAFHKLPRVVQHALISIQEIINAPLVGAFLAVIIGLTPLKTAFFAKPQDGGFLRSWFTTSLENIGGLFNALQMFVVGSNLYESMRERSQDDRDRDEEAHEESGDVPQDKTVPVWAVTYILFIRFAIMPAISIGLVYVLVVKTELLGDDPMMWFALMFAAAGPPAINIASLSEVAGESALVQQAISRFLIIAYAITPVVCFSVVGALRACEIALDQKQS